MVAATTRCQVEFAQLGVVVQPRWLASAMEHEECFGTPASSLQVHERTQIRSGCAKEKSQGHLTKPMLLTNATPFMLARHGALSPRLSATRCVVDFNPNVLTTCSALLTTQRVEGYAVVLITWKQIM